jgi:DNA polymerase-3 subunit epsilon
MLRDGVAAEAAWLDLAAGAASVRQQPAPTVIHFAQFERPLLRPFADAELPWDIVCTHEIARRLLPDLPRCSLRALAGYFGLAMGTLRRSADHVQATVFVWRQLVRLLEGQGVSTWRALGEWLAGPVARPRGSRRVWPMPRAQRLALPDVPGVYRLLRSSGDVVYIGKASSLHHRVNSYFRRKHGVPERMLEMLSQVRAISFEVTPSALEAALIESDEIKQHRPPYNIALTDDNRRVWFASPDLGERSPRPSPRCSIGPFPSADVLDRFAQFACGQPASLAHGRSGPDLAVFTAGYARLFQAHHECSARQRGSTPGKLLRLGTRLWREGWRDRETERDETASPIQSMPRWTPEVVQSALEELAVRAALARRRATWFTRLLEASVVWCEPGAADARLLVLEKGEVVISRAVADDATPPVPPGHARPLTARHGAVTVAHLDRVRVLMTELKRLAAAGAPVALRCGLEPVLTGRRLAAALWWV